MCDCTTPHIIYTDYQTQVCTYCGEETLGPLENRDFQFDSGGPLFQSYSRNRRFAAMLRAVLYPSQFHPKYAIITKLKELGPHTSIDSILLSLRKIKLPNKQYQFLHLYCKLIQVDYIEPPFVPKKVFNNLMREFADVEHHFERTDKSTFFSYNWLLRKLLTDSDLPEYADFIKKIKCKQRNQLYEAMFQEIMQDPESSDRVTLADASNSAIQPLSRWGDGHYDVMHLLRRIRGLPEGLLPNNAS